MAGLGSLYIDLLARTGKFETDIGRAARVAERRSKQIQQQFDRLGSRIGVALGAYASVQGLQTLVRISDEYTQLRGRLALVTSGTEELGQVQQQLFAIAQRTRTEMSGVADLYIKLAQTGRELGASQQDLLRFTEGVGNALTVSGATAQQASGALLQLSQALAGGTVRAEEFNSIVEGAPEILRTVAANMEGMGGSVAKLRKEVLAGKVSSQEFFQAFLKGTDDLSNRAQSMPVTVGQAFTRMQNNINQAIGGVNMTPLVDSINQLSDVVADPQFQQGFASFVSGIIKITGKSAGLLAEVANVARFVGESVAARLHGAAADDIVRLEDELEDLKEFRSQGWLDPDFFDRGRIFGKNGVIEWYSDADLDKAIAEIEQKIKSFYERGAVRPPILAPLGGVGGPPPPTEPSEEFVKLTDKLKEKIALYGQVGEAAEIAYKIQAGAFDELSKAEQQQLLALAKRYDAVKKSVDAEKEKVTEQEKAAEKIKTQQKNAVDQIKNMIKSAEEQIATFEKGEAAAVAYRLAHGELAEAFGTTGGISSELNKKIADLTAQMEDAGNVSGTVSESISDFANQNARSLEKGLEVFKSDFEQAFNIASESTEDLAKQLIAVTMHLELLTDTARGAAEAVSDFASQNSESLNQSLQAFEADFEERFIKGVDKMTVFQEQAARNTQDIIADTLLSGFDKGVDGVLRSFGDMIVKLTAQAVAADIAGKLFGKAGGGTGDGWISMAASWLGTAFGGNRAIGGPVLAGATYRINEREPEFFRPRVGGDIIPLSKMPNMGGGTSITQNFSVRTETGERVGRRTEQQIAAAASRGLAMASRRNN